MSRRLLSILPFAVALAIAAPATADQAKTITATGSATVRVTTPHPLNDASITAALDAATKAAAKLAIKNARESALVYAEAAGMTLGPVVSVSDSQNGNFGYYGPGPFFGGSFGGPIAPNQFCGVVTAKALKRLRRDSQVTIVDRKRRRICFVPRFASDTLTVTYSGS